MEAGGATVFPRAGVSCWPRRGSAAFWFNLYKNGEADPSTRHGACPVLHGSKWGTLSFPKILFWFDLVWALLCSRREGFFDSLPTFRTQPTIYRKDLPKDRVCQAYNFLLSVVHKGLVSGGWPNSETKSSFSTQLCKQSYGQMNRIIINEMIYHKQMFLMGPWFSNQVFFLFVLILPCWLLIWSDSRVFQP